MPIDLPGTPGLKTARVRLLDWGGRLVPIIGGEVQDLQRLGTRFSMEFALPPMPSEPEGRIWSGALMQAKLSGGARIAFLQDGFSTGSPGSPAVNGSEVTGTTIPLRGAQPGYTFRYRQFVNLIHGGKRYLHFATAVTQVAEDGTCNLPVLPMLRVIADDGDAIEVARPTIEGSLSGNELAWDIRTEPFTELGTIRIDENG